MQRSLWFLFRQEFLLLFSQGRAWLKWRICTSFSLRLGLEGMRRLVDEERRLWVLAWSANCFEFLAFCFSFGLVSMNSSPYNRHKVKCRVITGLIVIMWLQLKQLPNFCTTSNTWVSNYESMIPFSLSFLSFFWTLSQCWLWNNCCINGPEHALSPPAFLNVDTKMGLLLDLIFHEGPKWTIVHHVIRYQDLICYQKWKIWSFPCGFFYNRMFVSACAHLD